MDKEKQLQCLKNLSIRKEVIKQKVNELRRQKYTLEREIDNLVNQMVLAD